MAPRIMLLNGSPSAGKSTLARELWATIDEPFFYLDLDEFSRGYGSRWADRRPSVIPTWLRLLRALVGDGHDVIAPAVIVDANRAEYHSLFGTGEFTVYLVGVVCPLEEAERREAARTDRRLGPIQLAVPEWDQLHRHAYDVVVDTSTTTPADGARSIQQRLRSTIRPHAFSSLG